VSQTKEV